MKAALYSYRCRGFTLTEIAIVLGIIGFILSAIWTAASRVYANYNLDKAATETLSIVHSFKSLYAFNRVAQEPNGTDITALAMSSGFFPPDMVQQGNTTYALGPWGGSQVNVYSGATWNAITVAFWNIDQTTCNRLADAIATGNAFPGDGLVWEGVNSTYRTLPPYGTDQPFTVSGVAAACASGGNINVQVTYSVN
jgi:prepilin-type N-terminal cleavage/methylation domain-containing protein